MKTYPFKIVISGRVKAEEEEVAIKLAASFVSIDPAAPFLDLEFVAEANDEDAVDIKDVAVAIAETVKPLVEGMRADLAEIKGFMENVSADFNGGQEEN